MNLTTAVTELIPFQGETSWGKTVELMTISHPVISSISDAVAGDSFPMVSGIPRISKGRQEAQRGSQIFAFVTLF